MGVPQSIVAENGEVLELAPGPVKVIDQVPVGRLVMENEKLVEADDDLFRTRRRLSNHGTVLVGLVLDAEGSVLAEPQLSALGAVEIEHFGGLKRELLDAVVVGIEDLDDRAARDDEKVREAVRVAVRQALDLSRHRRPIVEVQVTRLTPATLAQLEEA
jgi:ribonuclease J